MAKQKITVTKTVTRTKAPSGATVSHSSPAGKTKIGTRVRPGNPYRCIACGRFMTK